MKRLTSKTAPQLVAPSQMGVVPAPKQPTGKLIQNAFRVPEEDLYIRSTSSHDFVTWTSKDGRASLSADGGNTYVRRVGADGGRTVDWCLYDSDPFELIAERLLWGSYGETGTAPIVHRPIAEFAPDHLRNILTIQLHSSKGGPMGVLYQRVIEHWLATRTAPPVLDLSGELRASHG